METKLKKINGKSLQFVLSGDEEKVLKVVYYQAKAKLAMKDDLYDSENVLFTNRIAEELTGLNGLRIRNALRRLVALKLIKVYFNRDSVCAFRRYRYIHINCKKFDEKYCWSN